MDERGPIKRTRLTAEQRRESILKAAVEVFASAGYRNGKMSDVAARVGVSEPVIFQNFGSKGALFAAVLERVADEVRPELGRLADHCGSSSELLVHALGRSREEGGPHAPGAFGVLFADAAALIGDPDLGGPAGSAIHAVVGHLADVLRLGQSEGAVRAGLDPEAGAWLLLSVLSARPLRAAAMPDAERLEDGVVALVLQALAPPDEAPSPA